MIADQIIHKAANELIERAYDDVFGQEKGPINETVNIDQ